MEDLIMSSKKLLKIFLNKFSGLLILILLALIAFIVKGDFKSVLGLLNTYKIILIPFLVLIIIVRNRAKIKGFIGEKSVSRNLSKLNKEKFKIINNIMLNVGEETTQIDHLVVSNYGLFIIETKNYSGWILGNEYDNYWTQVIYKRKEKLYNPIRQNYRHIKALQEILKNYPNLIFHPIVAFTKRADLKVQTSADVVYTSDLTSTINKYCTIETISDVQKEEIYNKLMSLNVDSRSNRKKHIDSISVRKAQGQDTINRDVCPKCGSALVLRKGLC